jgi:general secretion pathway protein K
MMTTFPSRQRGVAIITAVVIAAMVAAIAGFMAFRQGLWLRQVENQHDIAQARGVAIAAIDVIRLEMREDARQGNVDSAKEAWNQNFPAFPVEKGMAGGHIQELQGRFNINNLIKSGNVSEPDVEVFKRILASVGLSADLVPAVLDWMDADSETRYPGGAEDREYLAMDPPRRAANRPFFVLDELAQVKGWNRDMVKRIEPYVSALPGALLGGPINVNFAPPEVLMALMPSLDAGLAATLAKRVKTDPFATLEDFRNALPPSVRDDADQRGVGANDHMGVESHYFYADVDAKFGRVNMAYRALLERDGDRLPKVIWLRRR